MSIQNSNYELLSNTRNYVLFLHKYIYDEEILSILGELLLQDDSVTDYTVYTDGEYSISLDFGVGKISDEVIFNCITEFFSNEEVQNKIESALLEMSNTIEISENNIDILRDVNRDVLNGEWFVIIVLYDKFDYITKMTISL